MDGYEVLTPERKKVGRVVGKQGDYVIIEHGHLRKTRSPLPRQFVRADDAARAAIVTIPPGLLRHAPHLAADGTFDEAATAAYYGVDT